MEVVRDGGINLPKKKTRDEPAGPSGSPDSQHPDSRNEDGWEYVERIDYAGLVLYYSWFRFLLGPLGAVLDTIWGFWKALPVHVTQLAGGSRRGLTTDSPESLKNTAISVETRRIMVIYRYWHRHWGTS